MGLTEEQQSKLRERLRTATLVDGHAHNLCPLDSSIPFLRCFSEAEDEALQHAPYTLSFKRCLRDIASLYGCAPSLESVQVHRSSLGDNAICTKCFQASGIAAVLLDDGLRLDKMYNLDWHKQFFPNVYRVLRVEALAEDILQEGLRDNVVWTLDSFLEKFLSVLRKFPANVVAFKSIAAYRGGLNIDPLVSKQSAEEGLQKELESGGSLRITNKSLGDLIFLSSLEVATTRGIPMQIHTGFGDKDLDLRLANPLHLRSVLEDERFSKSQMVLLHASYPFSKEASHLASVYSQVYLDFGLAVPKLSVSGMQAALSEILHLAPLNKIMFSTDGYAFPETFLLGVHWSRETLLHVLGEACAHGDLMFEEALEAIDSILGKNAIELYNLKLDQVLSKKGCMQEKHGKPSSSGTLVEHIVNKKTYMQKEKCTPSSSGTSVEHVFNTKSCMQKEECMPCNLGTSVKYVRLLWSDGSGQRRCRVIPKERFTNVTMTHGVGLTMCCMAMPSHMDGPALHSNLTAVGEIRLMPDMMTKHVLPWSNEEEIVLANMHLTPGTPWEYCPRSTLGRLSELLQAEFGLVLKAGFENEFYILKPNLLDNNEWIGLDSTAYCSSTSFDSASGIMREISDALSSMGVTIEQMHAEAGSGQFEFAIKYSPCVEAADHVLLLRETVKALVQKHGFLATFLPKFFLNDIGSGSHVHVSLWQGDNNVFMGGTNGIGRFGMSTIAEEFMAGVLHHLPSILVFTAPLPNSYDRIKPNTWSGAYQCWGRENREAPLRASCPPGTESSFVSNFELKSFDGCANPHLGLAALLAAGIDGLRNHLKLPDPIDTDPSASSGTLRMLPTSLGESVKALTGNAALIRLLGDRLTETIIAIRKSEVQYYEHAPRASTMLAMRY